MAQLTFDDKEIEALIVLLQGSLADLSYEIADTDRMDFRNQLKERRELLQKILTELKEVAD